MAIFCQDRSENVQMLIDKRFTFTKCKSAKSNRKKQHGERGMTASLLKNLFTENTHLTLTKKYYCKIFATKILPLSINL